MLVQKPLAAKRLVRKTLRILLGAALVWLAVLSWSIVRFGARDDATSHDAAIVLGAAAYVFRERIRHALTLYRAGTVRKLIFTGGLGPGAARSESEVARDLAVRASVPAADILIEMRSHTTRQNLLEAKSGTPSGSCETRCARSPGTPLRR